MSDLKTSKTGDGALRSKEHDDVPKAEWRITEERQCRIVLVVHTHISRPRGSCANASSRPFGISRHHERVWIALLTYKNMQSFDASG